VSLKRAKSCADGWPHFRRGKREEGNWRLGGTTRITTTAQKKLPQTSKGASGKRVVDKKNEGKKIERTCTCSNITLCIYKLHTKGAGSGVWGGEAHPRLGICGKKVEKRKRYGGSVLK